MSSPNELVGQENEKTNKFHKEPMLTSALILITLMPLQVSPRGNSTIPLGTPLAVAVFVDTAKILGFPELRLRDSRGNLYVANKTLLEEPLAMINDQAFITHVSTLNKRKAHIVSYVKLKTKTQN